MSSRLRKTPCKPSTIRRREVYQRRKRELLRILGDVCAHCGALTNLTFDHTSGLRDWEPKEVHSTKRLRIYLEEARAGLGQLLCLKCNSAKGNSPEDDETF